MYLVGERHFGRWLPLISWSPAVGKHVSRPPRREGLPIFP